MIARRITIVLNGPRGAFDVEEDGKCCNGLGWDEMLGQVAVLTLSPERRVGPGSGYRMQTPAEWAAATKARYPVAWVAEHGHRGGPDDKLLPIEQQPREVADVMRQLAEQERADWDTADNTPSPATLRQLVKEYVRLGKGTLRGSAAQPEEQ